MPFLLSTSLALLATQLAVAPKPTMASLCLEFAGHNSVVVSHAAVREFTAALAARIARRALRISICSPQAPADFHLSLAMIDDDWLTLEVKSDRPLLDVRIPVAARRPQEVVQLLAIYVAEAIRPSVDALLRELGTLEDSEADKALASLDAEASATAVPPAPTVAAPVVVPESPRPFLRPKLGLDFVSQTGAVIGMGQLHIQVEVAAGPVAVSANAAARLGPSARRNGVQASPQDLAAGLGFVARFDPVSVGLKPLFRVTRLQLSGLKPGYGPSVRTYDDVGMALMSDVFLARLQAVTFGIEAELTVWRKPRRFLVMGKTMFRQPRLDGALGVFAGLGF